MYQDFNAQDPWTQATLHCVWKSTIVAIATRHADAVDIGFDVEGRTIWIAIPATTWVEHKQRTGTTLTDRLAAQVAGRFLKTLIERGDETGRDLYTMSQAEAIQQIDAVLKEAGTLDSLPVLPEILS